MVVVESIMNREIHAKKKKVFYKIKSNWGLKLRLVYLNRFYYMYVLQDKAVR